LDFLKKVWGMFRSTATMALVIKLACCVSVFVLSMLFWWNGIIICAVLICVFIAVEASVKSIVYIIFFVNFEDYMRDEFKYITLLMLLVCAILYIVKKSRNEKKQFLLLVISISVYLIYSLAVSYKTSGGQYLALLWHLLLLFFLCNFKDDLNFKTLVYVFISGMLTASFIGLFANAIPELAYRTMEHRAHSELTRFSALAGNPNRLHPYVFVAINGLFVLDLKKQISSRIFIPLLAVSFGIGLATISRTFCLVVAINLVIYVGLKFWYDKKSALKQIAIVGISVLVVCVAMYNYTTANLMRIGIIEERELVQRKEPLRQDTEAGVHPDRIAWASAEDFEDPGRVEIWKRNLKEWRSSPRKIFFGHGYDSHNFGMPHTHNLYFFLLVKTGVFGVILFIFFLFALFYNMYKVKKYKFNWATLLFLVVFAVHSIFELRFPAIIGFIFFYMFIFSLEKKKELNQKSETSI